MLKRTVYCLFAALLLTAMLFVPVGAAEAECVLDLDFGNKNWNGDSYAEAALPIQDDYAGNLSFEAYVKIDDFNTPTVIVGAWGEALHGYAFWCNGGSLYFSSADTYGNNSAIFDSTYTEDWEGKWIHLVGIKSGYTNTFYVAESGSEEYVSESVDRTTDRVCSMGDTFIVNGKDTQFEGAGSFSLGSVRLHTVDMTDYLVDLQQECIERLEEAGDTPIEPSSSPSQEPSDNPSQSPSDEPSESPSDQPSANLSAGQNGTGKPGNAQTFDFGLVSLAAMAISSVVVIKKRK